MYNIFVTYFIENNKKKLQNKYSWKFARLLKAFYWKQLAVMFFKPTYYEYIVIYIFSFE